MTNTESFYSGGIYPLEPNYGSAVGNYSSAFSQLGTSLDARTANQLKEVSKNLNTGLKTIEVAGHSPEVFDAIPKEQFKEINRMAKLTGAELTLHAPMIDPSGITQQGWDKMNQEAAEQQLWSAIQRSHDLNPKGNVNVTMHASTVPLPAAEMTIKEGVGKGAKEITKSILLITPKGQLHQIKQEEKYFPREGEKWKPGQMIKFDPEKDVIEENKKIWTSQLENINHYSSFGSDAVRSAIAAPERLKTGFDEKIREKQGEAIQAEMIRQDGRISQEKVLEIKNQIEEQGKEEFKLLRKAQEEQTNSSLSHGKMYIRGAYTQFKDMFDNAYKGTKPGSNDRKLLDEFAQEIAPKIGDFESIERDPHKLKEFSDMVEKGVNRLAELKNVEYLKPLREFAIEKTAETTSNLALKSFKEFGESAPIIALENHPAQQSLLTTGQDLKEVIEAARKKFIKKAVEKEGMSYKEAELQSKKLIGATWDVGHINMLRKYGYDSSDIIKETKKVAPYVKHVHLSDNFGFEHTELPMGMGNVPIKEIMQNLDKEGFKGKKVAEALSWWQHFSEQGANHAIVPTMQAMGSPVYSMQAGPTWGQYEGVSSGYFSGYGTINPEIHHSLYGAGFSSLPMELGGQIAGKDSRMTGTPMS